MAYTFAHFTDGVDYNDADDVNLLGDALNAHEFLTLEAATEITVSAGGEITLTQACHKIQPNAGAADNIDTISGMDTGDMAVLYASDAGVDTLTFRHGVDNISCMGGADIELSEGAVICYYDGATVYISGGGGGIATDAIWDALGDLAAGTGADTAAKLTVGANGERLEASSGEATGLEWVANDGWQQLFDTWTFSADDAPTYVISVNADVTGIIGVGQRLKLTHAAATKYFIVTVVGAFGGGVTLITVYGGTDYTLAAGAITNPFYSMAKAPLGFPLDRDKWTVEVKATDEDAQANPVATTWYNPGVNTIDIPIGLWIMRYDVTIRTEKNAAPVHCSATLSTANNSESDAELTVYMIGYDFIGLTMNREKILELAVKDTYYMNIKTDSAAVDEISIRGNDCPLFMRAISAYL